jgi:hypothetical protein
MRVNRGEGMKKLFFAGIFFVVLAAISVIPAFSVLFTFSDIPEPATMLLLGAGLICFAVVGKKKFFNKR